MEQIFATLRCGAVYVKIYRRPTTYYASLFGQLPLFNQDELEKDNIAELITVLAEQYFPSDVALEILNDDKITWSKL